MKGNKLILVILITFAIPLYIYDVLLLVDKIDANNQIVSPVVNEDDVSIDAIKIVRFIKKGKSPLLAYKTKPKVVVKKKKDKVIVKKKVKPKVKLPKITITGIMWNPNNPVVMISLPDGTSTMARAGQSIGDGIVIKNVDKNSIVVVYMGERFTVRK